MTTLGLWIDDPVSNIKKVGYWDELQKLGFKTAALMLEGASHNFDCKYSIEDLTKIGTLARERDIELVLTCWPHPTVLYLNELEAELGPLIEAAGASGIEVDVEGNWMSKQVQGFPNLDKAGDRLVSILKAFSAKYDVRLEATTYTLHAENGTKADVANHCHRLLPQAYSVRNRTSGPHPWDGAYGPIKMQKLTLDRALSVPGDQKLSCGLAAYDQTWPDHTAAEAMQAAYDEALKYNPEEIRFWSSKWIVGVKKNRYAAKWILTLKK